MTRGPGRFWRTTVRLRHLIGYSRFGKPHAERERSNPALQTVTKTPRRSERGATAFKKSDTDALRRIRAGPALKATVESMIGVTRMQKIDHLLQLKSTVKKSRKSPRILVSSGEIDKKVAREVGQKHGGGKWKHRLIPSIKDCLNRTHGEVNFHTTPFLSGHGWWRCWLKSEQESTLTIINK